MKVLGATLVLLVGGLFPFGCSDNGPNDAVKGEGEEHYRVYVSAIDLNTHAHSLNVMDMPADTLIDSVTLGHGAEFFQLTPDNQNILIRDRVNLRTLVYDGNTLTALDTLGIVGPFFVDRQRNIMMTDSVDWLLKVDPQSFEVVTRMHLPTAFSYGYVHEATNVLYISDRTSKLYLIDYVDMLVTDSIVVRNSDGDEVPVWDFVPVPEFKRVYFGGEGGAGVHLYSYDTADVITDLRSLTAPSIVTFARTDDGRSVFESDPGREFMDEPGSHRVWAYDVPVDALVKTFSTAITDAAGYRKVDVDRVWLAPNEKCLLATGSMELALLRYDLATGSVASAFSFMYPLMPLRAEVGGKIE